jgi:hypothetical protein
MHCNTLALLDDVTIEAVLAVMVYILSLITVVPFDPMSVHIFNASAELTSAPC